MLKRNERMENDWPTEDLSIASLFSRTNCLNEVECKIPTSAGQPIASGLEEHIDA